jgi:hypothetical protein
MSNEVVFSRRLLIMMVAVAAVLQWGVVLERAGAAAWAWYKFVGYGGGGHIDVSQATQAVFLVGSCFVAAIGYLLYRAESHSPGSEVWKRLACFGWSSIAVCVVFWTALLLSPLVASRHSRSIFQPHFDVPAELSSETDRLLWLPRLAILRLSAKIRA